MKKTIALIIVSLSGGCGWMWDNIGFGNPFPSAEEQIAEKCTDASRSMEVLAGLNGSGLGDIGQKVFICEDRLFEDHQEQARRDELCLIGHDFYILIRQISPQDVCKCSFRLGFHIFTGNLYNDNQLDNEKMLDICKDFSTILPEPHSYQV